MEKRLLEIIIQLEGLLSDSDVRYLLRVEKGEAAYYDCAVSEARELIQRIESGDCTRGLVGESK